MTGGIYVIFTQSSFQTSKGNLDNVLTDIFFRHSLSSLNWQCRSLSKAPLPAHDQHYSIHSPESSFIHYRQPSKMGAQLAQRPLSACKYYCVQVPSFLYYTPVHSFLCWTAQLLLSSSPLCLSYHKPLSLSLTQQLLADTLPFQCPFFPSPSEQRAHTEKQKPCWRMQGHFGGRLCPSRICQHKKCHPDFAWLTLALLGKHPEKFHLGAKHTSALSTM